MGGVVTEDHNKCPKCGSERDWTVVDEYYETKEDYGRHYLCYKCGYDEIVMHGNYGWKPIIDKVS